MDVYSNYTSHSLLLSAKMTGAVGDTTPTDPRSRRNRASRRGGQLLTRALSSSSVSACPHLRAPDASVPDGRTIRHDQDDRSRAKGIATLIPVTNTLERLNREVKRRADVVGIFPNEASIVRLIGAVLMEANDEWSLQHRYLSLEPLNDLASTADEEPGLLAPPAGPAHPTPAAA